MLSGTTTRYAGREKAWTYPPLVSKASIIITVANRQHNPASVPYLAEHLTYLKLNSCRRLYHPTLIGDS
jgi:hypothetical protein